LQALTADFLHGCGDGRIASRPRRRNPAGQLLLFLFVEDELVVQVFLVVVLAVEVFIFVEVLVFVVVEGEAIVLEILVIRVKAAAHFERLDRHLPGQHGFLRHRIDGHGVTRGWACYDAFSTRAAARAAFFRSTAASCRLRSRMDCGVTSISSSSSMYSRAYSSVICRGGSRMTFSSDAVVRMLDSFFSLVTFTSRSLGREFSPASMPS